MEPSPESCSLKMALFCHVSSLNTNSSSVKIQLEVQTQKKIFFFFFSVPSFSPRSVTDHFYHFHVNHFTAVFKVQFSAHTESI